MNRRFALAAVAVTLVCLPARAVDLSRDVPPILATHCFNCHGRDEKAREASSSSTIL
ncbi:MAG: hypothetical protein WCC69_07275 [Pirellulales bacterium]